MDREKPLKVAILGGSGKIGRFLIQKASEAGYQLRVLTRSPDSIKTMGGQVEIVKGDARDFAPVLSLLQGCDAVLSALGRHQGEAPVFSTATNHILTAMKELGIRRYILVTALSVDAPGDHKDMRSKMISSMIRLIFHDMWADKQKELDALLKSDLDWTEVRLPIVVDEPSPGPVKVDLANPPGKRISGWDAAEFVLAQINDPTYIRKAPFIAN